ncbi:apses transcription factor xbp1 [Fusarium phyllophilum]|uniref:Apses transcription factor xbp1 n=1 Tax=Fusarium phyllophilum TaxID=47803 RepID=A0A8H5NLN2_9HYPO|nr:apses transcription factor xbp1 [Fusarium phyllophilum]
MLSLKGLLNPAPAGDNDSPFPRPSLALEFLPIPNFDEASNQSGNRFMMVSDRSGPKDGNNMAKSKLRGPVKFHPFERLDEIALQEIHRFRVKPFGNIQDSSLHIPYNSGKKDFYEKTGRESFEVFKYEFTLAEQNTEYAVMWDYNVGLVRMTPFFKCRGYGKANNSGKDLLKVCSIPQRLLVVCSSVLAGYWMPYTCARAVCATFCYSIAGALIPIFGPDFPSLCIHPSAPDFGRMVISQQIIIEATHEAEMTRRMHMSMISPSFQGATTYPRDERSIPPGIYAQDERRHRFRPRLYCDPSWAMDSDVERHYMSAPNSASSSGSGLPGYMVTSRPGSSWTVANQSSPEPNPLLSAVPRIPPLQNEGALSSAPWGPKRRLEYEDWDSFYRESASPAMSPRSILMVSTPEASPMRQRVIKTPHSVPDAAQKDAAMLLLNLRMQDQGPSAPNAVESPPPIQLQPDFGEGRRSKRLRTTSLSK